MSATETPTLPLGPILSNPARLGPAAIRERLESALARRGMSPAGASSFAAQILDVLPSAGLEIQDRGYTDDLKAALSDWLTARLEDIASGGNGSDIDFEEVVTRSCKLLDLYSLAVTIYPETVGGSHVRK